MHCTVCTGQRRGAVHCRFAAIFEGLPIALTLRRGFGDSDGGLLREVTNRQNQG